MAYRALVALGNECILPYDIMYHEVLPYLDNQHLNATRVRRALVRENLKKEIANCRNYDIPYHMETLYFQNRYFTGYRRNQYKSPRVAEELERRRPYLPPVGGSHKDRTRKVAAA